MKSLRYLGEVLSLLMTSLFSLFPWVSCLIMNDYMSVVTTARLPWPSWINITCRAKTGRRLSYGRVSELCVMLCNS